MKNTFTLDEVVAINQEVIKFMKENEMPLTYTNIEHLFTKCVDEFVLVTK